MNSDFIEISFSEKEQEMIAITELYNNNNDKYGTKGGNDTEDKVFLLSIEEAEKYFSSDAERQCKPSDKVKELALQIRMTQYESCWWLRSPGKDQKNVAFVNAYGEIDETGAHKSVSCAFRPAMWISVSEEPQETVVSEEISVGDIITLGTWQQKTNPNSGKHPIEWQVLDIQDGKALVLSKYIIEAKYIKESSGWLWETSDFRNWLNNDFFNEAFSSEEQDSIFKSTIKNPANPKSGKGGGKDTTDKVFLLSYEEIDKYFPTYEERKAESVRKVADINLDIEWCMRTKAIGGGPVHISTTTGLTQYDDGGSWDRKTGLRPAMWIEISEEEQQTETVLLSEATVGDYVIFGSYEQDNNLENGAEPIEWKVLDVQDGKALVISKYGLDCKPYNTLKTDITWETCSLRKWLNSDFINEAFGAKEQQNIAVTKLSNQDNPKTGTKGGKDTEDKVFLLDFVELRTYFDSDNGKQCKATKYAIEKGATKDFEDNCYWWLRSPGVNKNTAIFVDMSGRTNNGVGTYNQYAYCTVRPAMWVDLSAVE